MSNQDGIDIVLAAIRAHTRVLKLPTVGRECDGLARQALADGQHPFGFLRAVLDAEIAMRVEHAAERRLRATKLPARRPSRNLTGGAPADWSSPPENIAATNRRVGQFLMAKVGQFLVAIDTGTEGVGVGRRGA